MLCFHWLRLFPELIQKRETVCRHVSVVSFSFSSLALTSLSPSIFVTSPLFIPKLRAFPPTFGGVLLLRSALWSPSNHPCVDLCVALFPKMSKKKEEGGGRNPHPTAVAIVTSNSPHLANYRSVWKGERVCTRVHGSVKCV